MLSFVGTAPPVIYCAYPAVVLLGFLVAFFTFDGTLEHAFSKRAVVLLLTVFSCTQLVQLFAVILQGYLSSNVTIPEYFVINSVSCFSLSVLQIDGLLNTTAPGWNSFRLSWILAIPFEISIALLSALTSVWPSLPDSTRIIIISLTATRITVLFVLAYPHKMRHSLLSRNPARDEERILLPSGNTNRKSFDNHNSAILDGAIYGSITEVGSRPEINSVSHKSCYTYDPNISSSKSWIPNVKYIVKLTRLTKSSGLRRFQIRAISVVICLLISTCINILVPIQAARVVNNLYSQEAKYPWIGLFIFSTLCFASSILSLICEHLWIPLKCFITEALTRKVYSHLLHLSANYHHLENVMEKSMPIQGASVISETFGFIFVQLCPWFVQLCAATIYLSFAIGPYQGFVLAGSMFIHLFLTSKLASEVTRETQILSKLYHKELLIRYKGFFGWNTIIAFNQNGYEDNLHSNAVSTRISQEKKYFLRRGQLAGFQRTLLVLSLTVGVCHIISQATVGRARIGQLAMLLVFWSQLQSPLYFLSRAVQNAGQEFSQVRAFFSLLQTRPSIFNKPNARPLKRIGGEVKFDGVSFSYEKHQNVINSVNIEVTSGETVYVVGAQGSGKSTLLRLLNRSFDVTKGAIRIDGQDIRDVDLSSLRDRVGIVSDTCFIFDDTILNNVRYSRVTASDDEVFQACHAALLHDKILGFPQGYTTIVGDNGIKLSIAELQKIAIAREILRNPDILVLDNATSALDPDTERRILACLTRRCQKRTTFIVNHRLPTIVDADHIFVIDDGRTVEHGTHRELILSNGIYAAIWSRHNSSSTTTFCGKFESLPKNNPSGQAEHQIQVTDRSSSFPRLNNQPMVVPSTPQNVKEGSRLNPIAPTFTPKMTTTNQAATKKRIETSTEDSVTGTISKPASSQTSHQWSDDHEEKEYQNYDIVQLAAIDVETCKKNFEELPRLQYPEDSRVQSPIRNLPEPITHITREGIQQAKFEADSSMLLADESADHVPKLENSKFKCPRYSRRVQSKSEPPYTAENPQSERLPQDESKNESPNRRVSAPLPPPKLAGSNIPRLHVLGKWKAQSSTTPSNESQTNIKTEQRHRSKKLVSGNNTLDGAPTTQRVITEIKQDKENTKADPIATDSPSPQSRITQRQGRRRRGNWHRGRRARGTRGA